MRLPPATGQTRTRVRACGRARRPSAQATWRQADNAAAMTTHPLPARRNATTSNPPGADSTGSRASILAAARAEFAAHGLTGARVNTIANRAGVNKQLIYYYFGSKDDLYRSALETVYTEIRTLERSLQRHPRHQFTTGRPDRAHPGARHPGTGVPTWYRSGRVVYLGCRHVVFFLFQPAHLVVDLRSRPGCVGGDPGLPPPCRGLCHGGSAAVRSTAAVPGFP